MTKFIYQELSTKRLILRRLVSSDWKEILALRSHPEVMRYIKRPFSDTKEKALQYIDKMENRLQNREAVHWGICKKQDNALVGTICLWNFSQDELMAELGYDLHPDFQGKGMMSEALERVLQFGFTTLRFQTIEAFTHYGNQLSRNFLERNRFVLEDGRVDPDNADNVIYSRESFPIP